jgi:hypothetical protein
MSQILCLTVLQVLRCKVTAGAESSFPQGCVLCRPRAGSAHSLLQAPADCTSSNLKKWIQCSQPAPSSRILLWCWSSASLFHFQGSCYSTRSLLRPHGQSPLQILNFSSFAKPFSAKWGNKVTDSGMSMWTWLFLTAMKTLSQTARLSSLFRSYSGLPSPPDNIRR